MFVFKDHLTHSVQIASQNVLLFHHRFKGLQWFIWVEKIEWNRNLYCDLNGGDGGVAG